jgi:hypothetical protein
MSLSDNEMSVVAAIGACAVAVALSVPTVFGNGFAGCGSSGASDDDADKDDKQHVVINASLAMKAEKQKQPQKQFKEDQPDQKLGVNNDPNKAAVKQCCVSEADCNSAGLAFPTKCAGDALCENNRCLKPKKTANPDNKDPKNPIPNRPFDENDPTGKPTPNTVGAFDGSKHGLAKVNSGDPWFARLSNDFFSFLEFPKLEQAGPAQPCVRFKDENGEISETEFLDKHKSDNEGLNGKVEDALRKLKKKREQNPERIPDHLKGTVLTQWTCFPVNNLTRQQD